jgi:hypothetical protein
MANPSVPATSLGPVTRLERYAPLTGVGAVVLWVVGGYLLEKDDRPDGKDTAEFVAWVETNDTAILSGGIVFSFGVLLFLWMLGSLRSRILEAESGTGRLGALAFGSGIATCVCLMAMYLGHAQAAFDHENISDTSVDALVHAGDSFFGGVQLFLIPLTVATAIASVRHDALPRWFGWLSLVLALILALPLLGWLGVYLGLPLWVVTASVLLYRRPEKTAARA